MSIINPPPSHARYVLCVWRGQAKAFYFSTVHTVIFWDVPLKQGITIVCEVHALI